MPRCPAGHPSTDPEFCSVCGLPLPPSPRPPPVATPAPPAARPSGRLDCPLCGEPRSPADAPDCPVCCYGYAPPRLAAASAWELVVVVDPSLDDEPDPSSPCPLHLGPTPVAVDRGEMVVGRLDPQLRQEVPLHDPGASRRHARFVLDPDGSLAIEDLGSTNGTHLNSSPLAPHQRRPLRAGDQVTLGRWTRIVVRQPPG